MSVCREGCPILRIGPEYQVNDFYTCMHACMHVILVVDCGPLPKPEKGYVHTPSGTTYNSVATYYCIEGYVLLGNSERRCGFDGSWSPAVPSCVRECNTLSWESVWFYVHENLSQEFHDNVHIKTEYCSLPSYSCWLWLTPWSWEWKSKSTIWNHIQ